MNAEDRWRRVDELCQAALECDAHERLVFLRRACAGDDELQREVESLLVHSETAEGFLAVPAAEFVANARARDEISKVGQRIAHYHIVEKLGAGGMGVVYRAEDTKLRRAVALKFLAADLTRDEEAKRRFVFEAQTASALEHPNICTIYEIGEAPDGQSFLAMAYYAGETLKAKIERGPLSLQDALGYATQIAEGLVKAHASGIVHRDIKPANVLVTSDGLVKIVDFGIAKLIGHPSATRLGATLGTLAYMSPEQRAGAPVDARSDVWSLGVVLYEMVAGRRPFGNDQSQALALAIDHARPEPLTMLRDGVPIALERIVNRALAKSPGDRYCTADLLTALRQVSREAEAERAVVSSASRARIVSAAVVAVLVAMSIAGGWLWHRASRERWALETATPEIARLVDAGEFTNAAALIRKARAVRPTDPALEKLWMRATDKTTIQSVPAGADVSIRPYGAGEDLWNDLGKTPLNDIRIPKGVYIWRIAEAGFAPAFFIDGSTAARQPGEVDDANVVRLRPKASVPPEMTVVTGGASRLGYPVAQTAWVHVDDYLIDRHEVTNEEYKTFIDAGGYQKREFWKEPLVKNGRTIPFVEAVALFHDATGRPGPATWEEGSYRNGLAKHPVAGVSWYEAAAYAEFVGKSLPTVYHWMVASQSDLGGLITAGSNFRGRGTQAVGGRGAVSGFGTSDMAGNVKEWCWNESQDGKRILLGGGFGEPSYMFNFPDQQSPWDRRLNFGFRCAKIDGPPSAAATAKVEVTVPDFWRDKSVSDDIFEAYRGLYAYDKGELHARVDATETGDNWTREKVSFDAAYAHERVIGHLFLPRNRLKPLQAVVYFPGAGAMLTDKLDLSVVEEGLDFVIKSGRALIVPIYKGFYERQDGLKPGGKPPAFFRDHVITFSKDLGRTLDYLQTRKDIDQTRMAYFGFSMGGSRAPVLLAIEPRFKAAILSSGGFELRHDLPEVDGLNFAPRVNIPVLMLNGRYDQTFPVEASQLPLFHFLGTPGKDKKHVIYEAGHGDLPHREEVRESLEWLDRYLGPVRQ